MVRAVFCVLLAAGIAACDASTAHRVELPNGFATPANTSVVGTAVPVLAGPGPKSDAQFAPGWFALLRVDARPREAYAALARSAARHGVDLPPRASACHALDCCNSQNVSFYDDNRCIGHATSPDGRTFVSVVATSCTSSSKCKRNGHMIVSYRSTRVQRAPALIPEGPTARIRGDEASGTSLLAAVDSCEGGLSISEVLTDPHRYWERLKGAVNRSSTARMRFQGRSVRLRFTSTFGDDASYAMTSGPGLSHPVVAIQHCG